MDGCVLLGCGIINTAVLTSPLEVKPAYSTLVAALESAAHERLELLTLHAGNKSTSINAASWLEQATRWARLLKHSGVEKGDRVVL